jgi:hypothetical protein
MRTVGGSIQNSTRVGEFEQVFNQAAGDLLFSHSLAEVANSASRPGNNFLWTLHGPDCTLVPDNGFSSSLPQLPKASWGVYDVVNLVDDN